MKKSSVFGMISGVALGVTMLLAGGTQVRAEENSGILDGVYIGNVNVGGMSAEHARSAVEEYVNGLLDTTFILSGENGSIEMTAGEMGVSADTDTAVEAALHVGKDGSLINRYKVTEDLKTAPLVLDMHLSVDKQATAQQLYKNSGKLSIEAVDNSLVRENGTFRFVEGQKGIEVNIVESVYVINDFLASGWDGTNNEITLVSEVVEPRGSQEELAQIQDLLGSYSTNYGSSSAGRAKNVSNGCSKVNGTIVYPGEEFKFQSTVSPFSQENGYELAGSYQNGTTVESFGGGICQVSTTLYNAAIRAELDITMRYNHSMQVSYVQPSMDAAIAGDYKDLRFINNYDIPIYIEGSSSGGILTFNIFGKETRDSNREVSFESETISTIDPEVQFNLDSSQPAGYWSIVQNAHVGCTAQLWKIVKVGGVEQSRELFNKSTYQASPKIILIGTKGLSKEQLATLDAAVKTKDEATVRSAVSALAEAPAEEEPDDKPDNSENENQTDKPNKTDPSDKKDETTSEENTTKPDNSNQESEGDSGSSDSSESETDGGESSDSQ